MNLSKNLLPYKILKSHIFTTIVEIQNFFHTPIIYSQNLFNAFYFKLKIVLHKILNYQLNTQSFSIFMSKKPLPKILYNLVQK